MQCFTSREFQVGCPYALPVLLTDFLKSQGIFLSIVIRLWGENFFNAKTKKWAKQKDNDNKRSFCMYVLDPIYKVFDAIMNFKKEEIESLLQKIGVTLKHEDSDKDGKALLKVRIVLNSHKIFSQICFLLVTRKEVVKITQLTLI